MFLEDYDRRSKECDKRRKYPKRRLLRLLVIFALLAGLLPTLYTAFMLVVKAFTIKPF